MPSYRGRTLFMVHRLRCWTVRHRAWIWAALGWLATLPGCGSADSARPDLVWGVRGSKPGWINKPRAAAFDRDNQLYLVDLTDRVQVFDREGKYLRGWRMPAFNVDGPSGVSFDRWNRLLVADTHFYRVLVYSPEGRILLQIGDGVQGSTPGRFTYPCDVVADHQGNFYVADYGENDRVQVFSPEGKWLRQWGGHGFEPGQFLRPRALAIDADDNIYVADSGTHRIQVFDTQGKLLRTWGTRGDQPGELAYPFDVAVGPDGYVYVCEYGNHRVQKFSRDGTSLGMWGEPGRGPGQLFNPWALAVDQLGTVSVVDSSNHRVQRFRM